MLKNVEKENAREMICSLQSLKFLLSGPGISLPAFVLARKKMPVSLEERSQENSSSRQCKFLKKNTQLPKMVKMICF